MTSSGSIPSSHTSLARIWTMRERSRFKSMSSRRKAQTSFFLHESILLLNITNTVLIILTIRCLSYFKVLIILILLITL